MNQEQDFDHDNSCHYSIGKASFWCDHELVNHLDLHRDLTI